VLGRQPIVHRKHAAAGGRGDPAANTLVGFKVAQHPTAAMQEEEAGQVLLVCRTAKYSQGQAAARTLDGDILARGNRIERRLQGSPAG
jgi:hypothetical protein